MDAFAEGILIRAQAAQTFEKRNALYRQLIQEAPRHNKWHAQGWYQKGLNEMEEAKLVAEKSPI